MRGGCDRADLVAQREPARGINTAAAEPSAPPTDARHREAGGAAADSEEVEQEEQEGQDADDEAEAEEPQKKKEKKKLRRRTIAKPDASVEWQAERAMLAAREAQVIYDGMGWTLRVGSVRLCDV